MPVWAWILVAFAVLATLLAIGGYLVNRRWTAEHRRRFAEDLERANQALAAAHAADKGWEPARLEAAARREFARAKPGVEARELHLIQVEDRPGTEEDRAVFRVTDDHGHHHELALARRGDDWVAGGAAAGV
jgi:hypothetical protein